LTFYTLLFMKLYLSQTVYAILMNTGIFNLCRATGAAAYQAAAAAGQTGYAVTPASAAPATYQTQRAATTGYENAYQAATTHTAPGTYAGM
jgi:hypothetical protein